MILEKFLLASTLWISPLPFGNTPYKNEKHIPEMTEIYAILPEKIKLTIINYPIQKKDKNFYLKKR